MNKEDIKKAFSALKDKDKRKFTQSYDCIINLKNVVTKQNPINLSVVLHHPTGKQVKIAAFVDTNLEESAKEHCDLIIKQADLAKYADKKVAKKLAEEYDFFIAQASLMPKVAAAVGKVLGARGKMPNPKMGCVVPPNASNVEPLVKRLKTTVLVKARKGTNLQCLVGKEGQDEEQIIDNIITLYNAVVKALPNQEQNVKNVLLKKTMGAPVRV